MMSHKFLAAHIHLCLHDIHASCLPVKFELLPSNLSVCIEEVAKPPESD